MKKNEVFKFTMMGVLGTLLMMIGLIGGSMVMHGRNFPLVKYYYWKGFVAQRTGDMESAIENFDKVNRLDANFAMAYISRGSAYLDLDQHKEAIADYTKAIQLLPEGEEAYAYRGRAFYEIDSLGQSKEDFDKALQLNKDFVYAYLNRALLRYTKLNDFEGGCEDLNIAAKLGDANAKEYLKEGYCD